MSNVTHADMANAIRALAMDAVQAAKSGHPGMPMGMADVATVLFTKVMTFDAAAPDWPDRDRFVLSAGHGSMLIYSLAYLLGYEGMDLEDIKNFRQLGAKTAGHPESGHAPGVETTTGPLGQGLSNAVGMAMAEAHLNAQFSDELVNHFTYVIAGDGCLMEGISQEALSLAGKLQLKKLIVLWDDNEITIDGAVSLADKTDQLKRFEASGWETSRVDGHDPEAIEAAIRKAQLSDKPSLIACKTVIGKGSPNKSGTAKSHGSPLGEDEIVLTRKELDWPHAPFEIPEAILNAWREAGARGVKASKSWSARLEASQAANGFLTHLDGVDHAVLNQVISDLKKKLTNDPVTIASRVASQKALELLNPALPTLFGGSADLTGSNNTRTGDLKTFSEEDYSGRYVHYGVREHAMAAAMNGLALHGGVTPYGGAFLVFSDYCRASIRLAALMGVQSIFVFTHDSIGLGEDGPTHQPVEHLAALRAIPNLNVFRPADIVETAECWQAALLDRSRPSILALSRQGLRQVRTEYSEENLVQKGAYVLRDADNYKATLIATGSEVELAVDAAEMLAKEGISVRVVSLPNWRAFKAQSVEYQQEVLGSALRIGIEAASSFGWAEWLGDKGEFIGIDSFGASGPKADLYQHFGITAERVVELVTGMA